MGESGGGRLVPVWWSEFVACFGLPVFGALGQQFCVRSASMIRCQRSPELVPGSGSPDQRHVATAVC